MPYVAESLIIRRKNKLVGLVFPDFHDMEEAGINLEELEKIMNASRIEVNIKLALYEQIGYIELKKEEFEKTPKKSIKRFLYFENKF